jgi:hypothetical protein
MRNLDLIQRTLDEAEKHAASLEATIGWWQLVAREYEARAGAAEDGARVSAMIQAKCRSATRERY